LHNTASILARPEFKAEYDNYASKCLGRFVQIVACYQHQIDMGDLKWLLTVDNPRTRNLFNGLYEGMNLPKAQKDLFPRLLCGPNPLRCVIPDELTPVPTITEIARDAAMAYAVGAAGRPVTAPAPVAAPAPAPSPAMPPGPAPTPEDSIPDGLAILVGKLEDFRKAKDAKGNPATVRRFLDDISQELYEIMGNQYKDFVKSLNNAGFFDDFNPQDVNGNWIHIENVDEKWLAENCEDVAIQVGLKHLMNEYNFASTEAVIDYMDKDDNPSLDVSDPDAFAYELVQAFGPSPSYDLNNKERFMSALDRLRFFDAMPQWKGEGVLS
jgi:hypothetical protein